MNSRLIQAISAAVMILAAGVGGALLPGLDRQTEAAGLRYTDVSVEGAPPFVAIGTAIGALRGLIVNYLWIKVNYMKDRGLYYEVMADAELITKLQPRFGAVWAFQGHNMAYNISVAAHSQEERWQWVNAGIRLVRDEGLRYNPNDLTLHKELAFWFAHKIEGVSDDAHLYYKREFCREWHMLLGRPPDSIPDRVAWIKKVADAPETLEGCDRAVPGVLDLVDRFNSGVALFADASPYEASAEFLRAYGLWVAVTSDSAAAEILGQADYLRSESPFFQTFDALASDPAYAEQWDVLLAHTRKRVLIDEYNMSPQLMYEYTRDLGPIDWRHGQAHALYWSRRGSMVGEARLASDDNVYRILNNDRMQLQAMQDLARFGRIQFDPFSQELPSRFPEPRWIDTIDSLFYYFYDKHYNTRGAGGESFIGFLRNFMASSIRQMYRSGEFERAEMLLAGLREKFGVGTTTNDPSYSESVESFVQSQVQGEYAFQPHIAPSEAFAALRYAFREGVGRDRRDVWDKSNEFVEGVIAYFRGNEYNNFVNKFGEKRMADILGQMQTVRPAVFADLMADSTISLAEKATLWERVDRFHQPKPGEPPLRLAVYDRVIDRLRPQYEANPLSRNVSFDELFPAPPGLESYRAQIRQMQLEAEERARAGREREAIRDR